MKKIIGILLLLTLIFGLASCGDTPPDEEGAPSDDGGSSDGGTPPDDGGNATLSYLDDMSRYVTLAREDYTDIRLTASSIKPSAFDVENEVVKLLYRSKAKEGTSYTASDMPAITPGDSVVIYYRGYYIEDGARVYFDGGCNLASSSFALGIGSGQFIGGFELGLIGRVPSDYVGLTPVTEGKVCDGDIVIVSYDYVPYGMSPSARSGVIVDLSEDVDAIFGDGFRELVVGAELGVTGTDSIVVDGNGKSDVITSLKVGKIFRVTRTDESGEALPVLTVSTRFPSNYGKEELNGREAFFDVYVMQGTAYDTPDFDDAFVTGTLNMTAADLEGYAGESLADKYRAMILETLNAQYDGELRAELTESLLAHFAKKASVVSMPSDVIAVKYQELYDQVTEMYKQYMYYYSSLDSFAIAYFDLAADADWRAELGKMIEDTVIKQAAFYYVGQAEGFIPEEEELDAMASDLYNSELYAFLDYYGIVRDNFDSEGEYNAMLLQYSEYFSQLYPLEYFRDQAVIESILDGILENFVTVE